MTNSHAARVIDTAHKAYRRAIGTGLEASAYVNLCSEVRRVQRAQEEAEWDRLIAIHRSAA